MSWKGGFLFGFVVGVISAATPVFLTSFFRAAARPTDSAVSAPTRYDSLGLDVTATSPEAYKVPVQTLTLEQQEAVKAAYSAIVKADQTGD